jgi:hypothetical protein
VEPSRKLAHKRPDQPGPLSVPPMQAAPLELSHLRNMLGSAAWAAVDVIGRGRA